MANPDLLLNLKKSIATKLVSPLPGTTTSSANDMTIVLAKTRLSTAADIVPPFRRKQQPRGRCAAEETKRSSMRDGRLENTRGNGFVLLHMIVAYGVP